MDAQIRKTYPAIAFSQTVRQKGETTMAASVSAWAKPGAWALDSEENEAELQQQPKEEPANGSHHSNGGGAAAGLSDFPSLAAAAATRTKKKSKGQTLSLQEFTAFGSVKQQQSQAPANKGLTPDELFMLPTGPRQRSAEELDRSKLGGGFRSYGSSYDRPARGSSDEQPRRQRESSRDFAPSRADEIDDWGATKKSPVGNGFERRERGERGFFSDSQSRADEVDNWASKKTFVPSEGRKYDRRGGFESNGGGADTDSWYKKKEDEGRRFGSSGGAFDSLRERRGGGFESNGGRPDSDNWGRKREEGGGRPRLNLQPRTLPVGEVQQENGSAAKPRGSNPFGNARPREEVLKEKGQDPKEIEEKLESLKIKEAAGSDGPASGKGSFGIGNWRGSLPEDRTERTWRKPEPVDARPPSADKTEDGPVEEVGDKETLV